MYMCFVCGLMVFFYLIFFFIPPFVLFTPRSLPTYLFFILYFCFFIAFPEIFSQAVKQTLKKERKRKKKKNKQPKKEKKKKRKKKRHVPPPQRPPKGEENPAKKNGGFYSFLLSFLVVFFCGNDIYNTKDNTDCKYILIRKYVERVMWMVNCVANSKQQCHHNTVLLSCGHLIFFFVCV
ncbi:uncharacterized protein PWA37_005039 [Arxiozyma heterogenica]|uniref:uncharacterized protein n=1 Tax=Arxiozyma heterogenica TaxID=278026 RepID=UPI002EDF689E